MMISKKDIAIPKKIVINEFHTKKYLEKLKTTYKEKVVFILPNGKEF